MDPHATDLFRCLRCGQVFEDLLTTGMDNKAWCPYCDRTVAVEDPVTGSSR